MKRLGVELPVCPECRHVGRHPVAEGPNRMSFYCTGSKDEPHRKVKMERVAFVEKR